MHTHLHVYMRTCTLRKERENMALSFHGRSATYFGDLTIILEAGTFDGFMTPQGARSARHQERRWR